MAKIRTQSPSVSPSVHVLIIVALRNPEWVSLRDSLRSIGAVQVAQSIPSNPRQLHDEFYNLERWTISDGHSEIEIGIHSLSLMGNGRSAIECYGLVDFFQPAYVFIAGIAGSLRPDTVQLGDVVIAESVTWFGHDRITGVAGAEKLESDLKILETQIASMPGTAHLARDRGEARVSRIRFTEYDSWTMQPNWKRRAEALAIDHLDNLPSNKDDRTKDSLRILTNTPQGQQPRVNQILLGKVLSADFVLDHRAYRDELAADKALAVEMESGGLVFALKKCQERNQYFAQRAGKTFAADTFAARLFVFRGISDLCAEKSDSAWRQIAATNAMSAMSAFIVANRKALFP